MLKFGLILFVLANGVNAMANDVIWSCTYNNNPNAITISGKDQMYVEDGINISVTEPDLQAKFGSGFDAEGEASWLKSNNRDFSLIGGEYERIDVTFVNGGVNFQLNSCREAGCVPNPEYSYWFENGLCVKH